MTGRKKKPAQNEFAYVGRDWTGDEHWDGERWD